MTIEKQNEHLRKQNARLALDLDKAKKEIERLNAKCKLFEDLESKQKEFEQVIADLRIQKQKYSVLNRKMAQALNELKGKRIS